MQMVRVNITVRLKDPKEALAFMRFYKRYTEADFQNGLTIGHISTLYGLDDSMTYGEIVAFAIDDIKDDLVEYRENGDIETLVDVEYN